jgi:putative transposase
MRPFGTPRELEQRRLLAVRLLSEGVSTSEVARRSQVDSRSVRRWRAAARAAGEVGIAAKPARGRPRRLKPGDLALLRSTLTEGQQAPGGPARAWSCAEVAGLIERQFGVHYHRAHVNRILHTLGIKKAWT